MDDQVRMILSSYTTSYESFKKLLGEEKIAALSAIHQELLKLAEQNPDIAGFSAAAAKTDLFNRFSQGLQKVSALWQEKQKQPGTRQEITIDDLRNQIELLARDASSKPFFYKYAKIMADYLALAKASKNPAELTLRSEENGIPVKMASAPVSDQYKLQHDRLDPNEVIQREFMSDAVAIADQARSVDELTYKIDQRTAQFQQATSKDEFVFYLCLLMANRLLTYNLTVANTRHGLYKTSPGVISNLIILREEIKNLYYSLKNEFALDWFNLPERYQKKIFAQGFILPITDRVFLSMDPGNLEWMREVLKQEILSGLTIPEILTRRPEKVFAPVPPSDLKFEEQARKMAAGTLKGLYWFVL